LPTYEYACTACGHRLEAVQKFTDEALTECPECGGKLRKVFGAPGIVLKGSGFYKTDTRAQDKRAGSGGSNGSSGSDSSSGSDGKSESNTKPDAGAKTESSTSGSGSGSGTGGGDKPAKESKPAASTTAS
jgi:putative FmdB family regulatory protein